MNMKRMRKALSCILCMVLIVAMALFTTGCSGNAGNTTTATTKTVAAEAAAVATTEAAATETEATAAETTAAAIAEATPTEAPASEAKAEEVIVLGEGSKWFNFGVYDMDGAETWFEIHTDEETVGAALLALELIEGDDGPYGLYVKTVNGITADYDKDKVYWAFYVNDEYGTSGVDMTDIEEGAIYSFRMAK